MKPTYYLTAYGIALKHGFKGTEEEWLISLTAFYLAQQAGFTGTVDEWLKVLNDPVPRFDIGEVKTLEGGSEATVSITGDKENPILNFGIPRGLGMEDALPLVGGKMKGAVDMDSHGIHNLPEPKAEGDAVNQKYADAIEKIAEEACDAAEEANDAAVAAQVTADNALPKAGGDMTGNINMGDKKVTGLGEPTDGKDAANKKYVDEKVKLFMVILNAENWEGEEAPYKQTISVESILGTDRPHYGLIYSEETETVLAEKEAWVLVDDLDTADGSVTFTCFEDKPEINLSVQMEVHR